MFTSFAGILKNSADYISCVMLRRKWRSLCPNLEFDSFEFLLLDNDGSTFQATAQKDLGSQFDCLLIEGYLYNLRTFDFVLKPKSNFLTDHDYIICLREDSVITQCKDPFPYDSIYCFKSFPDVLGYSTFCDGPLFDVIGAVVDIDEKLDGDRGIRLMLQDLKFNRLMCLISTPYVEKLNTFIKVCRSGTYNFNVVIIKLCKKMIYKGEVCISTYEPVTDVICNPFLPEIESYKSSIDPTFPEMYFFDGSKFPPAFIKSAKTELSDPGMTVYSIYDLSTYAKVNDLWTLGTITLIHEDKGWYFTLCSRCDSGCTNLSISTVCPKCGDNLICSARYKIYINLNDENGSDGCFVLQDEVATFLVENSVQSLLNMQSHCVAFPVIPMSVQRLIGKKILFKVKSQDHAHHSGLSMEFFIQNCCVCPILLDLHITRLKKEQSSLNSSDSLMDSDLEFYATDDSEHAPSNDVD